MPDHIHHAFEILKYVRIPEAQHAKASRFQLPGSPMVPDYPVRSVVLAAIELDHETAFETGEVGDESGDRNLAAEMPAFALEQTQLIPELLLGIGGVAAQISGELIGHGEAPHP